MRPSLSCILPCLNEAGTLPRQLAAIVPQLAAGDQLVLLDDGSNDSTWDIMQRVVALAEVTLLRNPWPCGVNAGYNQTAKAATRDWILGLSGNDEVQSGAIAAWREAAEGCPQARICFGQVKQYHLRWFDRPTFVPQEHLVKLWRHWGRQDTHGAAAFIRRDTWGRGYTAGHWMADWWQAWTITARWGCLFIPTVISCLSPSGFSSNHADDAKYNVALAEIRQEAKSAEYQDIWPMIQAYHEITGFLTDREPFARFKRR